MGVNKGLVPLGLSALLYRFGPPFTFITRKKTWRQEIRLAVILTGFLQKNECVTLNRVGASLISNHKYQTFDIYNSTPGCLWRMSQWEGADWEASPSVCCALLQWAPLAAPLPPPQPGVHTHSYSPILFISAKQNTSQDSQQLIRHICFSAEVQFDHIPLWNHCYKRQVCGRVFWMNFPVCVFSGLHCWLLRSPAFLGDRLRLDRCVASIIQ